MYLCLDIYNSHTTTESSPFARLSCLKKLQIVTNMLYCDKSIKLALHYAQTTRSLEELLATWLLKNLVPIILQRSLPWISLQINYLWNIVEAQNMIRKGRARKDIPTNCNSCAHQKFTRIILLNMNKYKNVLKT